MAGEVFGDFWCVELVVPGCVIDIIYLTDVIYENCLAWENNVAYVTKLNYKKYFAWQAQTAFRDLVASWKSGME